MCELVVLVRWYLLFVEKTFGQEQISCEASLLYCVAPIVDTEALWCSRMPISEKQLHRCELSLHFNIEIDHTAHANHTNQPNLWNLTQLTELNATYN